MVAFAQRNSPQCLHLFASALISPAQKGQALNMTDSASSGATGIGSRLGRKQGSPLAFPPRQVSIGKAWEIKRMRGSP